MFPLPFEIALVVLLLVIGTVLTEAEAFGWATLSLLITVVSVQMLHIAPLLEWVSAHWALTGLYSLAYLGIGVAWSFVKWFSFLVGFRDAYRAEKEAWMQRNQITVAASALTEEQNQTFIFALKGTYPGIENYTYKGLRLCEKPRATHNKSRIVAWMAFFPCSMLGTLLNDPIRRLFNWLFASFKALYQQMADAVFRNDKELL